MIQAFLYGIVLAFGLIIPLGIQNLFLFNQGATQKKFRYALPSIITASICDTILIVVSVLGVSVAVLTIPWLKNFILGFGLIFLLYMGWATWKTSKTRLPRAKEAMRPPQQILFAASVSLFNPHALLDSISVIGTNSLNFIGYEKVAFTVACVLVSCLWFFGMALAGHFVNKADQHGVFIRLLNKVSALIIWGVAVYIAIQIFQDL